MSDFTLPLEILAKIQAAIPVDRPVFLVGGAVRDALAGRPITDLDFTLPVRAMDTARRVANQFRAAYYTLDTSRDIGRVLYKDADQKSWSFDFSAFQGPDLEADLRNRDFTINAMALSINELDRLIDPLGGAGHLAKKNLVPCSSHSYLNDPVRILRAFRLAVSLNLRFSQDAKSGMQLAIPALQMVSMDRLRDELFRILEGPKPISVLRSLDLVGALRYVLPELDELKSISAQPPHISDAFSHSLETAQKLLQVLEALSLQHDIEKNTSWAMGLMSIKLGRYRQNLDEHLRTIGVAGRSLKGLMLLAALYHDIGKPQSRSVDANQVAHFYKHEVTGSQIAYQRARELRLSRGECDRISDIVKNHMRPLFLAQNRAYLPQRSVYRFFKATGEAGVDVCLLSLADTLATYGVELPEDRWMDLLNTVRSLLEGLWENPEKVVSPPQLVNGTELMEKLQLKPGPQIGKILHLIQEGQASGEIQTHDQALDFARDYLRTLQSPAKESEDLQD